MIFQGNYIDLLVMMLLFLWLLDSWDRGFFHLMIDLVAFVGSFLFGLRFYSRAAYFFVIYFSLSRGFANALGFFVMYAVAHSVVELVLLSALRKLAKGDFTELWQKLLGLLPATINGLIVISALLTLAVAMPIRDDVKQAVFGSEIGGYLVQRTSALEGMMDKVFRDAIQESMAFLTVKPQGKESLDLGFKVEEVELKDSPVLEAEMFAAVNKEREERGIKKLEWSEEIVPVARAHAMDMFERGYFSHISPEGEDVARRLLDADVDFILAGENLAFAPSLDLAHDGLMQSQGHRENILAEEFSRIGIGVIDGGSYGKMFVQVFAD